MEKTFRIVIPNPSPVIPSRARNLAILLRVNSVRNLVFSGKDCHVASLLAMTALKGSLNLGLIYCFVVILVSLIKNGKICK